MVRYIGSFRALLMLLLLPGLFFSCRRPGGETFTGEFATAEGQTMGTYYRATYADPQGRDFRPEIEELLKEVNMQISTYIDSSTVSRFNRVTDTFLLSPRDTHFLNCLEGSKIFYEKSDGAFDPTVMPLVNYWGFGYTGKKEVTKVDSVAIDSLLQYVGLNKIEMTSTEGGNILLRKTSPGIELDFGGIGQGYGVDVIAQLLERKGIKHYLVDVGGEMVVRGKNPRGEDWNIGINVPLEDAPLTDIQTAVPLRDEAVSTSGNYRNFYEVEGVKYSHEINPVTGFPERTRLLSASIFAKDCTTADGYATACMILGLEKAYELANRLPEIEAYFIYSDEDGLLQIRYTEELRPYFSKK